MVFTEFAVGLTGGIGSGKSLVADLFAQRGAAIIDTDQIAHRLTAVDGAALPAIRQQFGEQFLTANGVLDRPRMREHIFADATAKKTLEAILHPLIRSETEHLATQINGDYLLIVVPLLVESGNWQQRVSRILVTDCSEQLQISRVMNRNGFTEVQVRAIMANQASRQQRLKAADDVLLNEGASATLFPQIDRLHALYRSLAQTMQTNPPQHL